MFGIFGKKKPVQIFDEATEEKLHKIIDAAREDHTNGRYKESNEKLETVIDFYSNIIEKRNNDIKMAERHEIIVILTAVSRIMEINNFKIAEANCPKFSADNIDTVDLTENTFDFFLRYGQELQKNGEYDLAIRVARRADVYLLGLMNTVKEPTSKMHLAKAIAQMRATIAENETLKLFRKELEEPARLALAATKEKAA